MKLHIGPGKKFLPGFKHLDIMEHEHIDYVANANDLSILADGCVVEIYACHVLEHFGRHENEQVLTEWCWVLVRGGILRLPVPDFNAIIEAYTRNRDLETVLGLMHGGQKNDYDYHYQIFDIKRLEGLLVKVGFKDISPYDWRMFLPEGFDDYSRAYLPHMDIENGRQMSLNITAVKA